MGAGRPILRTLTEALRQGRLAAILSDPNAGRSELARRVCRSFELVDGRGNLQVTGCLAALRSLERRGHVVLPAAQRGGGTGCVRTGDEPVAFPQGVPERADFIRELRIVLVDDRHHRCLLNTMLAAEHPRGAVLHVGRQVKYLVSSEHGWLGCLVFSPGTRRLRQRDDWIGWDDREGERARLDRIVCISRFLIRPAGCRNLATRVLSLALRRLGDDHEAHYGERPAAAETFVDASLDGTCFRASGWRCLGETAGRVRRAVAEEAKQIYFLPLVRDWRCQLGARSAFPGFLDSVGWVAQEFGDAALGDARLAQRLVACAAVQARLPSCSFFMAAAGDSKMVKGYYRLIDHPDRNAVTPEGIMAGHRKQTLRRMSEQETVLLIQDGCDINLATRHGCGGLGIIGRNGKGQSGTLGLHMHATLAVNGDGVPLGVVRIEFDAPDGAAEKGKPLMERKTGRWLRGLEDSVALASRLHGIRTVAVMDREGDAFAVLAAPRKGIALLVRARHDRDLGAGRGRLFAHLAAQPVRARMSVVVERQSARNATRTQEARPARSGRKAAVDLRWCSVSLPETRGSASPAPPVSLTMIEVRETARPPDDSPPLLWRLLTTLAVRTSGDAQKVIDLYRLRWRIEDWHRVLKSGCKIEEIAHRTRERVERALALNAVIAWRIMALTHLGRMNPDLPAEVAFSRVERAILGDFARTRGRPPPDNLGNAFNLVTTLGGYLNRSNDPPPGNEILWHGHSALSFSAWIVGLSQGLGDQSDLGATFKRNVTCG